MVLTKGQIGVIKNDFLEKACKANKTWKEHLTFNCSRTAVYNLVKNLTATGPSKRWEGRGVKEVVNDGKLVIATTEQIAHECKLLLSS